MQVRKTRSYIKHVRSDQNIIWQRTQHSRNENTRTRVRKCDFRMLNSGQETDAVIQLLLSSPRYKETLKKVESSRICEQDTSDVRTDARIV
jgi:hypothetical protein